MAWSPWLCGVAALGLGEWFMSDGEAPRKRALSRRRRANAPASSPRVVTHKVKANAEEEARLLQLAEAQRVSIPRLLMESALAVPVGETPTERRNAIAELYQVHRLLAATSSNINQLAKVANSTGDVPAEAAATIAAMRVTAAKIDGVVERLIAS